MSQKPSIPSLMLAIPLRHAGMAYSAAPQDTATLIEKDGQRYSVQSGYLVPYYSPKPVAPSQRREELVVDRARRFFYTAEPELDVSLTRGQLAEAMDQYEFCAVPDMQKVKARYLVGAMVNRMERLARAMLQGNTIGIDLPEFHDQPVLNAETLAACKEEFSTYYRYLAAGSGSTPVQWVRLRNMAPDHDGILLDLVREMGKPIAMPEHRIGEAILNKIGMAMGAIDETHHALSPLVKHPVMGMALHKAYERAFGPLHDEMGEPMPIKGDIRYTRLLQEYADLCRARAGMRSNDLENFWPVRERLSHLSDVTHQLHRELRKISSMHGFSGVRRGEQLLQQSMELMRDMASARMPKNSNALDIYDAVKHPEHDCSSVGRLKEDIAVWRERLQSQGMGANK